MLMPLMIIDLRLPTSGTVVATDASEYVQGVCRAVSLTAAGKLEAKRLETQRAQRCDNRVGKLTCWEVSAAGELPLTNWYSASDFAFVGGRTTSNRIVTAAYRGRLIKHLSLRARQLSAIVGPPTPLVEMVDSHLQPLELCRPHQCIRIASTSRQSALAHEDAAVRWRALASYP